MAACVVSLSSTGCAVLSPRFPDDVQTAVVRDSMRRMETDTLVIYYPEAREAQAKRMAARVAYCTQAVREHAPVRDAWTDQKPRIVMADLPFNNAYVSPPWFSEPISVVPTHNTTDIFAPFHLPPDPGVIGCHESVHYVQLLQAGGIHRFFTTVFGSGYTPQLGLEPWFHEGVAVYYETKLQGGIGRLGTPYYEGILAAGVAGRKINGGWLHYLNREPTHGGHYLVASFFVDWLARTHGERKLWDVVGRQASAVLPPFGVNGRFEAVYGKSLSTLLEEFDAELTRRYPVRQRPVGQRMVRQLGSDARYHRTADGWEAVIDRALDRPTTLVVRNAAGAVVVDRLLAEILPGRVLLHPSAAGASGLAFSPDRRSLYFTMLDAGPLFSKSRLVRADLGSGALEVVGDDLHGPGGGLTPDGAHYVFSRAQGDAWGIASLDLRSKSVRWVRRPEPGIYYHAPRVSPDGARILAVRSDATGTALSLLDAASGDVLPSPAVPSGPVLEASWVDADRVVYVAGAQGRMQVFVSDLRDARFRQATHVPFLALHPQSDGRVIRFLHREGWSWTLDEVAFPSAEPVDPRLQERPMFGTMVATAPSVPKLVVRPVRKDEPWDVSFARRSAVGARVAEEPVLSDEPYSQLDGLLVPQVRGPWLVVRDAYSAVLGVSALGGDRLGYHRWAAGVGVDPAKPEPSAQLDYRNALMAPVFLDVTLARFVSREQVDESLAAPDGHLPDIVARETLGVLMLQRPWYDSAVAWGWRVNDVRRSEEGEPAEARRFAGPFAAFGHAAIEGTPYSGVRRRLSFEVLSAYMPKGLSTVSFNVTDVGARTGFVIPLPLSRRHTFRFDGRGRSLRGVPASLGLLQVGGGGGVLSGLSGEEEVRTAGVLPPSLRFFEPLRGFEDLARYGSHVVSGEMAYRFPFIIDRGTASSLSVLPSSFLREVAFEPFGVGASLLDGTEASWAAGASLDAGVAFWLLPLDLRFQLARRLSDDESWAFFFTVLGTE